LRVSNQAEYMRGEEGADARGCRLESRNPRGEPSRGAQLLHVILRFMVAPSSAGGSQRNLVWGCGNSKWHLALTPAVRT
jgi:hypothetical protein